MNTASSTGFPPVARPDARLLVLGSLPGVRSIQEGEYYAHPRNSFWRIMAELTGACGKYEQRCKMLQENRIALWDVLASSVRPGSLDSAIDMTTAKSNDFKSFLARHAAIERICFNGQKAAKVFASQVALDASRIDLELITLPSTSPAYAAMPYAEKLEHWRKAIIFEIDEA